MFWHSHVLAQSDVDALQLGLQRAASRAGVSVKEAGILNWQRHVRGNTAATTSSVQAPPRPQPQSKPIKLLQSS
jgi:hypothetical protein